MNPPIVECSDRIQAADLQRGRWVVVLRADEIPHVVMLQHGVCYSLEHDGNRRTGKYWTAGDMGDQLITGQHRSV